MSAEPATTRPCARERDRISNRRTNGTKSIPHWCMHTTIESAATSATESRRSSASSKTARPTQNGAS